MRALVVDGRRTRLIALRWLPNGVDAMTLPTMVLIRTCFRDDPGLLAHEAEHLRQWHRHGVAGFLARYLRDYVRGRLGRLGHQQAYLAISFEVEARAAAARFISAATTP